MKNQVKPGKAGNGKLARLTLSDSEDNLNLLFEHNPLPMWIHDATTLKFLAVNFSAQRSYGYTKEEFLSMSVPDIRPPEDVPLLMEHLKICTGDECLNHRARHVMKSGKVVPVEVSSRRFDFNGIPARLNFIVDVSERQKFEDAYVEADRKYRNIFENAVEGFYQNLPSGHFINVNPAFARMLGYDSPQDLCKNLVNIETQLYVNPTQRKEFRDILEKTSVARGLEYEAYRKDGTKIWVSVNVRTVRDVKGKVLYYEGTAEDITQRKQQEERLKALNTALEKHTQELARSNSELQQFAYAASHDLQEPLRMVSSYLNLVANRYKGRLDSEADEFIYYAVEGAKRMKLLIDDLLAFSRVGRRDDKRAVMDLNDVFESALKNLELAIHESKASVRREPLPSLHGSSVQVRQLFQNLLSNAIKFRGAMSPEISISAERRGSEWFFCVKDNGIGFDMTYADRIFRIFQRLHPRDEYPGTGVGLAICKKIVEGHGGRIWVESKPKEGASFYFSLPASSARDLPEAGEMALA